MFRSDSDFDTNKLSRFAEAVGSNNVEEAFGQDAIVESVHEDEGLVALLPKVRNSRFDLLPVVSISVKLLGIVNTRTLERRIVDDVIAAQRIA